jgi:hypothetical protein
MATTTNYGFEIPDDTDLVKDGAAAMRELGQDVDTQLFTALGGNYPGLRLVKKQTIGTGVSSVTVTGAFSATYDNYKIVISGGASSNLTDIYLQLGASADEYYAVYSYGSYNTSAVSYILNDNDAAQWTRAIYGHQGNGIVGDLDLLQPNLAKYTMIFASAVHAGGAGGFNGIHKVATAYTDFKITAGSGTLTGGTIYVYGYGAS